MKITFTTRIIAPTPHVGVSLLVETTAAQPKFNIQMGGIVSGQTATIDWGDVSTNDYTSSLYNANHTYAAPGIYPIKISNHLTSLTIAFADTFAAYGAMVKDLVINTDVLTGATQKCFQALSNLTSLDLSQSGITQLGAFCCRNCTSLKTFSAAKVFKFDTNCKTQPPFSGCTALETIHFAAANEAAIKATAAYEADPHLGAPTAELVFDL